MSRLTLKSLALLAALSCVGAAEANNSWIGDTSSDAHDATNWEYDTYDSSAGTGFGHNTAKNFTVDFGTKTLSAASAWLDNGGTGAATVTPFVWTATTGGFSIGGDLDVGSWGPGTLKIEGGTYTVGGTVSVSKWDSAINVGTLQLTNCKLDITGWLSVAQGANRNGTLKIEDGATVSSGPMQIGMTGGAATVEMTGGSYTVTGDTYMQGSHPTLKISGGTYKSTGWVWADCWWYADNSDSTIDIGDDASVTCESGIGKCGTGTLTLVNKGMGKLYFDQGTIAVKTLGTDLGTVTLAANDNDKTFSFDLSDYDFESDEAIIKLAKFTNAASLGTAAEFADAHVALVSSVHELTVTGYAWEDGYLVATVKATELPVTATVLNLNFEGTDWASGWTFTTSSSGSGYKDRDSRTLSDGTESQFLRLCGVYSNSGNRDIYAQYTFPDSVTGASDYKLEFDWFAEKNANYWKNGVNYSADAGLYIPADGSILKMLTNATAENNNVRIFLNGKTECLDTTLEAADLGTDGTSDTAHWYHIVITGTADSGVTLKVLNYEGKPVLDTTRICDFTTIAGIKDDALRSRSSSSMTSLLYNGLDDIVCSIPATVRVGATGYATLADAAKAAKAGDTITLLANTVLTETVTVATGVKFNFKKFSLTSTDTTVEVNYDDGIHSLKSETNEGGKVFYNEKVVNLQSYTWTGDAGDGKWTTAGNWYGDTLPTSDKETVFPATAVTAEVDLTGAGTIGTLTLNCPVTFKNGTLTLSAISGESKLTLGDGAVIVANHYITFGIPLEITGSSTFIKATMDNQEITISGYLTGNGELTLDPNGHKYINWKLSGNNGSFAGTLNAPQDNASRNYFHFTCPEAASKLAKWNVYTGDEKTNVGRATIDVSSSDRTFDFGELSGDYRRKVASSYTGINYLNIGYRNTSFSLTGQFGTWSDRCDDIIKVGTGKMTFSGSNVGAFTVADGTLEVTSEGAFAYNPNFTLTSTSATLIFSGEAVAKVDESKIINGLTSEDKNYWYVAKTEAGGSVTYQLQKVSVTVPTVANTTVKVTVGETEITAATDGKYYVESGSTVTVTYTANEGYCPTSTVINLGAVTSAVTVPTDKVPTIVEAVAKIVSGTTSVAYATVAKALDAAADGQTVIVLKDVTEYVRYTNNTATAVTLDLSGKTITAPAGAVYTICNSGSAALTITGNGSVVNTANDAVDMGGCVWARCGSITIENGTFTNNSKYEATVYIGAQTAKDAGAVITINGGTFVNQAATYQWKTGWKGINVNVWNSFTDTSALVVKGGTFSQNPADGDDKLGGTFVAKGYKSVQDETTALWTVVKSPLMILVR